MNKTFSLSTVEKIPTEDAVVFLEKPEGGWRWVLDKELAGVPPIQRLVFSMGRAGIKCVNLLCRGLDPVARGMLEARLGQDPRCRAEVRVVEATAFRPPEAWQANGGGRRVLLARGDLVTTPATVRQFLQERGRAATGAGLCLIGVHELIHYVGRFISGEPVFDAAPPDVPDVSGGYTDFVESAPSFRQAERRLLDHYRHHYTQLFDVYFNSHFSIPISSFLVRLPVTPNQVTLMGLAIGALAGWFFSRGDYTSGVLGGLLLAFTAIWDCCDGDVARLKFMESDFGETLDTACDNIINVFLFGGIAWGVARNFGLGHALTPFLFLAIGGFSIFALIYFPGGGKGDFFKGTRVYDVILLLASRNFIYVILVFALAGHLEWFLWLAGFGSLVFALFLWVAWSRIRCQAEA